MTNILIHRLVFFYLFFLCITCWWRHLLVKKAIRNRLIEKILTCSLLSSLISRIFYHSFIHLNTYIPYMREVALVLTSGSKGVRAGLDPAKVTTPLPGPAKFPEKLWFLIVEFTYQRVTPWGSHEEEVKFYFFVLRHNFVTSCCTETLNIPCCCLASNFSHGFWLSYCNKFHNSDP